MVGGRGIGSSELTKKACPYGLRVRIAARQVHLSGPQVWVGVYAVELRNTATCPGFALSRVALPCFYTYGRHGAILHGVPLYKIFCLPSDHVQAEFKVFINIYGNEKKGKGSRQRKTTYERGLPHTYHRCYFGRESNHR